MMMMIVTMMIIAILTFIIHGDHICRQLTTFPTFSPFLLSSASMAAILSATLEGNVYVQIECGKSQIPQALSLARATKNIAKGTTGPPRRLSAFANTTTADWKQTEYKMWQNNSNMSSYLTNSLVYFCRIISCHQLAIANALLYTNISNIFWVNIIIRQSHQSSLQSISEWMTDTARQQYDSGPNKLVLQEEDQLMTMQLPFSLWYLTKRTMKTYMNDLRKWISIYPSMVCQVFSKPKWKTQ